MVPPREVTIDSDDPFDRSDQGHAYWSEALAIEDWIAAGAPDPMTMWEQLQQASDRPEATAAPLRTPADVRAQGLASIEDACIFLGGISRDSFDRHVRRRVKIKHVGSRPYIVVESLTAYVESDSFKSLSA